MKHFSSCPSCQFRFGVDDVSLRSSYGWLSCPVCLRVYMADATLMFGDNVAPYSVQNSIALSPRTLPLTALDYTQIPPAPVVAPRVVPAPAVREKPLAPLSVQPPPVPQVESDSSPINHAQSAAAETQLSFVPRSDKAGAHRWWTWVGGTLLGMATLPAAALLMRDWLVTVLPYSQPVLQAACLELGCELQPYRNINIIRVDVSSLKKMDSDSASDSNKFMLEVALSNSSLISPTAFPDLDLSIMDADGRVILRKRVRSLDINMQNRVLAPQSTWQSEIPLNLGLTETEKQRMVGYKVVALYP